MIRHQYARLSGFALFCLIQAMIPADANALPVNPFMARYSGFLAVINVAVNLRVEGMLNMTLRDTGNGRYQMSYDVNGLLGSVEAQANGEFVDDVVRPFSYMQTTKSLKRSQTQLTFNWQNQTLRIQEDDERETLPLPEEQVMDPLSLYLLVMWDLQRGRVPKHYTLVDGTKLKTYQVASQGKETVQTPLGKLRTLRISSKKSDPDSDRVTTFWFAPSLGYVPVQIVSENDGKETLRMLLQELKEK